MTSIEKDHNPIDEAVVGDDVCIEIVQAPEKQQYMFGRQFDETDHLYSKVAFHLFSSFLLSSFFFPFPFLYSRFFYFMFSFF